MCYYNCSNNKDRGDKLVYFRKVMHFLSSIFFYSIMTLLVIIVCMFLAYFVDQKIGLKNGEKRQPLFGAYIIMSNSMVPSINVRDAILTMRVNQDKIKVNDIITFISKEIETNGTPITHRVIGIVETDNGIKYRTKGDHNNTADFALISPSEVIGKVYLKIPFVGYIQYFLTKPIGWLLVIIIPCLFIIGSDILKLFKVKKSVSNDNSNLIQNMSLDNTLNTFTDNDSLSKSGYNYNSINNINDNIYFNSEKENNNIADNNIDNDKSDEDIL